MDVLIVRSGDTAGHSFGHFVYEGLGIVDGGAPYDDPGASVEGALVQQLDTLGLLVRHAADHEQNYVLNSTTWRSVAQEWIQTVFQPSSD